MKDSDLSDWVQVNAQLGYSPIAPAQNAYRVQQQQEEEEKGDEHYHVNGFGHHGGNGRIAASGALFYFQDSFCIGFTEW